MYNSGVKLKDDVAWEVIDEFGDFRERYTIDCIEELPDDLVWFSYWRTATRGAIECIEINKATRAIHCQGCLDVLFDMIAAGLVEKQPKTEPIITYGGFFGGNGNYTIDYKIL
jgi:hypothetical protein